MVGKVPGPNDTVVRPVSTKEATLSSNIGPDFVKVSTPTCICGGIGCLQLRYLSVLTAVSTNLATLTCKSNIIGVR